MAVKMKSIPAYIPFIKHLLSVQHVQSVLTEIILNNNLKKW